MRYSAFISYNHRDTRWATWLHRALESYRIPPSVQGRPSPFGPIGKRLPPVFRDREELAASADLGASVREALADAATLIVICSPNAVPSRWVNEEIRQFTALGRAEHIRCLIVDGEPHAGGPREALPPALFENGGREPLAADIRKGQDSPEAAKLKLIAGMLEVNYDELRRREAVRRQRQFAALAAVSTLGFVLTGGLAVTAMLARNEAVRQRDIARQRTVTAERVVGFVRSMFEVSDPSQARGSTITARELVDKGAEKLEHGLEKEPAVRAELGVTLSEVYGSLGLYKESDRLIRRTFAIRHGQKAISAHQLLALGESLYRLGDYEGAIRIYRTGIRIARGSDAIAADLLPRMLVDLGQAQSAVGDTKAAEVAIRQALVIDEARPGVAPSDVARDLEALGLCEVDEGRLELARPHIERALAIRLKEEGDQSPSVADNLNTLGSIAYIQGDLKAAEAYYRHNVIVDQKVFEPGHPDIAATLNNLARVLLDRRAFAEAEPLLERAVAINLQQRDETHDDMAFAFANLAIAKRGLGQSTQAEALFVKALRAAREHKHRTLAPILTDLASLHCDRGDTAGGLALLDEARPIMAATYPDDPWRSAWTENVRGECLLKAGARDQARTVVTESSRILLKRWASDTLYGHDALRRLKLVNASGGA